MTAGPMDRAVRCSPHFQGTSAMHVLPYSKTSAGFPYPPCGAEQNRMEHARSGLWGLDLGSGDIQKFIY